MKTRKRVKRLEKYLSALIHAVTMLRLIEASRQSRDSKPAKPDAEAPHESA